MMQRSTGLIYSQPIWPNIQSSIFQSFFLIFVKKLSKHRFKGMIFGQLVIGPPGSGKTSYCKAMNEYLQKLGRKIALVNLDPANDVLPYDANVDVSHLITVANIMEHAKLGPNGSLIYCMEFLENKVDWLIDELKKYSDCYFLIDCPGQVELYTTNNSMQHIAAVLQKSGFMLSAVHLVDSYYCSDPSNFIAALMTSLQTMIKMEMPQINVFSKADLIEKNGKLHFNLDYYTEVQDLTRLRDFLSDDPFLAKYKKLNDGLVDLIENYSLVSFCLLSINNEKTMAKVIQAADKANGYVFGMSEENRNVSNLLSCAMSADFEDAKIAEVREKYMSEDKDSGGGYVSFGR